MLNLIDIIFDHMHTAMVRKWGLAAVEGLNLWSTFQWANKKKIMTSTQKIVTTVDHHQLELLSLREMKKLYQKMSGVQDSQ